MWKSIYKDFIQKETSKKLLPHEIERKNNAEISTPPQLRKDMLNKLPECFWNKKITVFEPCCGKGGFLIDIVDRFMNGLTGQIPNEEKRLKFILEKMLYFADINPLNIYLCNTILNPNGKYKLNTYIGDTLKLNIKEVWGREKFTAVIGNPPYSTDPSKQNTKPLYNLFTDAFIDKCQFLLYVIPSRWFSGGKGLDKFRTDMIKRKDLEYIVHTDNAKEWFANVVIMGGVSYFLKNSAYNGLCNFNGVKVDLTKYDIVVKPKYMILIDKLSIYPKISDIYMVRGYYGIETNDKRLHDIGTIPVWVSYIKCKSRKKYLSNYEYKDKQTWKVITSSANGDKPNFGFMSISSPNEIYTNSYIGFRAKNKEEAESILSYLKCKLPNHMLGIRKISQHINTDTCKWIPKVPFDRIWNDNDVMEYFGLSEDDLK